jgi:hypothetical protein
MIKPGDLYIATDDLWVKVLQEPHSGPFSVRKGVAFMICRVHVGVVELMVDNMKVWSYKRDLRMYSEKLL